MLMQIANLHVPSDHLSAKRIFQTIGDASRKDRELLLLSTLLAGHVPTHMRSFVEVKTNFVSDSGVHHTISMFVLPDYLCVGTDDDYVRVPLNLLTTQRLADAWNCTLPTTKMVDIIWSYSSNVCEPLPWGPPYDASMMSTHRIIRHNELINDDILKKKLDARQLLVGHKKDVVMTNQLSKHSNSIAIYGWHRPDGSNIQPLYLGHENTYCDYSHGERFIFLECIIDGRREDIRTIACDPELSMGISNEGPLLIMKQPNA